MKGARLGGEKEVLEKKRKVEEGKRKLGGVRKATEGKRKAGKGKSEEGKEKEGWEGKGRLGGKRKSRRKHAQARDGKKVERERGKLGRGRRPDWMGKGRDGKGFGFLHRLREAFRGSGVQG